MRTRSILSLFVAMTLLGWSTSPSVAADEKSIAIEDVSIEDLLASDIAAGESGTFGSRMSDREAAAFLHAFAITEANKFEGQPFGMELEFFNLLFGARLGDRVLAEGQLEITENGSDVSLRYGHVDVNVLDDYVTVRVGKFLAPIGVFNEYLYPEYLNKMVFPPASNLTILPRGFAVIGAQVRGKYQLGDDTNVNYAVFVSNNPLDAEEEDPMMMMMGGEEEEEGVASFVSEPGEEALSRKSFGGRIGARFKGVDVGVSGFVGTYDADEKELLLLGNVDAAFHQGPLSIRSEFMLAQKKEDGEEAHLGFFIQAAYRLLNDHLEPAVQYDVTDGAELAEQNRHAVTIGLNYYPLPKVARYLVGKVNGVWSTDLDGDESQTAFLMQAALGF